MEFTYNGLPGESPLAAVRFTIGDTDKTEPLLWDGEIEYILGLVDGGDVLEVSILACEAIRSKFARMYDESVGGVSKSFSQRIKGYADKVDELRLRLAISGGIEPYLGGSSKTDYNTVASNPDRIPPQFTTGMFVTPGSGLSSRSDSADDSLLPDGSGAR